MSKRKGAGLTHAWFCYLWHSYVPGQKTQDATCMMASCARCGQVMPRDEERQKRPCIGQVKVELR